MSHKIHPFVSVIPDLFTVAWHWNILSNGVKQKVLSKPKIHANQIVTQCWRMSVLFCETALKSHCCIVCYEYLLENKQHLSKLVISFPKKDTKIKFNSLQTVSFSVRTQFPCTYFCLLHFLSLSQLSNSFKTFNSFLSNDKTNLQNAKLSFCWKLTFVDIHQIVFSLQFKM